jgi:Leucine-rich repeat (LRR) protein
VAAMKATLLMIAAVMLVGCGKGESAQHLFDPNDNNHAAIEAAIRKKLKKPKGKLTKEDLEKVTDLYIRYTKLTDVNALANLTQLKKLDLWKNQLTDVKELGKLTRLTSLSLYQNKLTDARGLADFTQLEHLDLSNNQLTDVRSLVGLTNLVGLQLNDNRLTDLRGLETMAKLEVLNVRNGVWSLRREAPPSGPLTDLSAVAGLTQLETLQLDNQQLTDDQLKHLAGLWRLGELRLNGNNLTDVSSLGKLKNLIILDLRNNPNLAKIEVDKLRKPLPRCAIYWP